MVQVSFGGQPVRVNVGENTSAAARSASAAAASAAAALDTLADVIAAGDDAEADVLAAVGPVVDALLADAAVAMSGTPKQPAPGAMAFFGQDSADKLATDSVDGTRRITLPATANQRPASGADWYVAIHFRTGQQVANANREVLASNGSTFEATANSGISLNERNTTTTSGKWRFLVAVNSAVSKSLFKNLTPALTTQPKAKLGADYCIVFGVSAYRPHVAIQRVGATSPDYRGIADDVRAFSEFYFPAAAFTDATVERASNVITVRKASLTSTFTVGSWVLLKSTAQPGIDGFYQIASRLGSNAGFTVAAPGADFAITAADASSALMVAPFDLIDTLGGYKTAVASDNYGWSGGVQRIECRHGTMPITNGLIDAAWLGRLANRQLADADIPGTKRFALTTSADNAWAADADGVITGTATLTGTPLAAPPLGTDWLVVDPWPAHAPFASVMDPATSSATGTVEIGYSSYEAIGSLLAYVEDASGNTIVSERVVSEGTEGGRGTIRIEDVPNGSGYFLRLRPTAGAAYTQKWGPFAVGPSLGIISQSTLDTLFSTTSTGSSLAPISAATGVGTAGGVAGGLSNVGTQPTDVGGDWLRLAKVKIAVAGSVGDGIKAFTNKLIELQNTVSARAMAAAAYNLCRSGHPADAYWSDRKTWLNSIGTATAGVAKIGNWTPHPLWSSGAPVWIEALTPKLYRGGTLAQADPTDPTSPYVLTGGTLVATLDDTGHWSGAVTGTFNIDTGAYSITDPVGGALTISGTVQFDSASGTTITRLTADGFTAWGADDVDDSGHISNLLKAMPRQTAFVYSWANYLLSYASGATQAQVDAKVAFDIAMIRKRIDENYPVHAGTPWIVMADARTTSTSSIGEHKIRKALRAYALATANTYWSIGPITGEMTGLANPHPGTAAASGQLWGLTMGHGVAKALGIAGAKADEVYITGAARAADGTYVELTYNVPVGANLTNSDATKVEGIYFGTTDDASAMSLVDVNGGNYTTTIPAANKVRVTKASGTFPATTYWASHVGFVLTDAVLATENARLGKTLSLDTGGYDAIRPGQPVSFNFVNVLASQL